MNTSDDTCNSQKSDLACHSCRSDRVVPRCTVCQQISQVCSYPVRSLKPGPKLGNCSFHPNPRHIADGVFANGALRHTGSSQRPRKRRRESLNANDGDPEGGSIQSSEQSTHLSESINSNGDLDSSYEKSSLSLGNSKEFSDTTRVAQWNTDKHESRSSLHDLSFILHPSHESSSPEKERLQHPRVHTSDQYGLSHLDKATVILGLTRTRIDQMIKTYFDNMVAMNLFHEPTFMDKISAIESPTQVFALLGAMSAFASRFDQSSEGSSAPNVGPSNVTDMHKSAKRYLALASSYADEALKECGDEPPPLCILQAFILTAHCQLSQGVLGTAWRMLGTCVRLAYELNLHLIDMKGAGSSRKDVKTRCEDEEKRRAWWAIWEMDVFATTIRRTPTAIDWTQMEIMLPAEDEYWYKGQVGSSCYLEMDSISRWRTLRDSGNQSPKAWFIVINSLMKEAQKISTPHRVPSQHQPSEGQPSEQNLSALNDHASQQLESLANAVQCFVLALPSHLRYRSQYLGFDARAPGQPTSIRQLHCSIYNIHLMTQLARLMVHRYRVFGSRARGSSRKPRQAQNASVQKEPSPQDTGLDDMAMQQYFEASDNILTIVNRSCDDHIQYINPFLSFTIWLASAVQLVRRGFCQPGTNQALIKSRFEVLNLTYKQCVEFWDIKAAVQQNLETLEAQLEATQTRSRSVQPSSFLTAPEIEKAAVSSDLAAKSKDMSSLQDLPSIGSTVVQGEAVNVDSLSLSTVDNMHSQIQQVDTQPPTDDHLQRSASPLGCQLLPPDAAQGSDSLFDDFSVGAADIYNEDWRYSEIFNDIQNLLTGYPAYGVFGGG